MSSRIRQLELLLQQEKAACENERAEHEETKTKLDEALSDLEDEQMKTESLSDRLDVVCAENFSLQTQLLALQNVEEAREEMRTQLITTRFQMHKYESQNLSDFLGWQTPRTLPDSDLQRALARSVQISHAIMQEVVSRSAESPGAEKCPICLSCVGARGYVICSVDQHRICDECYNKNLHLQLNKCPYCRV